MIVHDQRLSITYVIKSVWTCCLLQTDLRVKLPCEQLRFIWLELYDSISLCRKRATLNEQEIWTTARLCCKSFLGGVQKVYHISPTTFCCFRSRISTSCIVFQGYFDLSWLKSQQIHPENFILINATVSKTERSETV